LHATCRSLANGMVVGASEGFAKDLQLIGVGYRGAVAGNKLTMNLGFSHPVEMEIPQDVEVKVRPHRPHSYLARLPAGSQGACLVFNTRIHLVEQSCNLGRANEQMSPICEEECPSVNHVHCGRPMLLCTTNACAIMVLQSWLASVIRHGVCSVIVSACLCCAGHQEHFLEHLQLQQGVSW